MENIAPLTLQQRTLWDRIQGGGLSYLDPAALRLEGPLNVELLRRSFEEIVRRHDSLRTRIVSIDGDPWQQFAVPGSYNLRVIDCSNHSTTEFDALLEQVVDEIANQGCDLAVGPLFEVRLLKLSEHEHVLAFSIHHIISDGLSAVVMFRDLWNIYQRLTAGRPVAAAPRPPQYAEYATWQRDRQRHRLEEVCSYWQMHLAGASPIRWRIDTPSIAAKREPYESVPVSFGPSVSARVREFAADTCTTVGLTILGIYTALVSRWCDQNDFVVATTVSGRTWPAFEGMHGYCAHAVYLRIRLAVDETFMELLTQVRTEFDQALTYEDFGSTVTDNEGLLGDALFQWFPWTADDVLGGGGIAASLGIRMKPLRTKVYLFRSDHPYYAYDFMPMFFIDAEGNLAGSLIHRSAAFSKKTVERMASELQNAAERLTRDPHALLTF